MIPHYEKDCVSKCLAKIFIAGWLALSAVPAPAQQESEKNPRTQEQPNTTEALTEGLLDLLKAPNENGKRSPNGSGKEQDGLPRGEPIGGEDSAGSKHEIDGVHQSMVIAAEFLNQGISGNRTQSLQTEIVARLDDIIEAMEKNQQSRRSSNNSTDRRTDEAPKPNSQQAAQDSNAKSEEQKAAEGNASSKQSDAGSSSGNGDHSTSVRQGFTDNRDLQEQVWGQLPDRVRKQMQSRMVEQFLPSYRERIRAYFEALLKEENQ